MKNKAGNDVQPLKRFKGFSKKDFLELIKLNHENIEIELPKSTPILKLKETIDSIPLDKFIITGKLKDKMTDNINQHKEYLVKEKTRLQKEKDSSTKDDIRKSLSEKLNEILKCIPVIEKTMKSINATLSDFNNKPFSNMISDDPKIPDNEKSMKKLLNR